MKPNNVMNTRTQIELSLINGNDNTILFDFTHGDIKDSILLEYRECAIEEFERCTRYGFGFSNSVAEDVQSEFRRLIMCTAGCMSERNLKTFIRTSIGLMDSHITLPRYNTVIIPQPITELCRKVLSHLSCITTTTYLSMESVNEQPSLLRSDTTGKLHNNIILLDDLFTSKGSILQTRRSIRSIDDVHDIAVFSIIRKHHIRLLSQCPFRKVLLFHKSEPFT